MLGVNKKKRQFRKLWITRLNAATRQTTVGTYSTFIHKVKNAKIQINRKMLSQLAIVDPLSFEKLQEVIKI